MRVGFIDLTLWSFLMASAHGAGLMLVPILLGWQTDSTQGAHMEHAGHVSAQQMTGFAHPLKWLAAVGVHSSGHLLVSLLIALLVYEKFGLAMLRTAWFNLDLLWMICLMISGVLILII